MPPLRFLILIQPPAGMRPDQLKLSPLWAVRVCPAAGSARPARSRTGRRYRIVTRKCEMTRVSADDAQLKVATHGADIQTTPAIADPRLDAVTIHSAVAQGQGKVAVDVPTHGRHRKIGFEGSRHLQRHVAADALERQVAAAGQLVGLDD